MVPELVVTPEPARVAAERLVAAWVAADAARGGARVAIAGGSVLTAFRRAVADLPAGVWARTKLTWVDERCVPFDDPASNRGAAHRSGAFAVPPAVELALLHDGEPVPRALVRVDDALGRAFDGALDLTLLGLGPDGHVASLFPGADELAGRVGFVPDAPKPPPSRITLTRAMLATASTHVLLATGEAKRTALGHLCGGGGSSPAVGLAGLVVITDLNLRRPCVS